MKRQSDPKADHTYLSTIEDDVADHNDDTYRFYTRTIELTVTTAGVTPKPLQETLQLDNHTEKSPIQFGKVTQAPYQQEPLC